jgi:hypothetical protein
MKKKFSASVVIAALVLVATSSFSYTGPKPKKGASPTDNAGLTLPAGFSAAIVASNLGQVRHIAITKEGDVYAKLGRAKNGNGI